MYSIVKKCDRCGRVIGEDTYNFEKAPCKIPGYAISINGFSNHEGEFTYELCEPCATDFLDWVTAKNATQTIEPHKEKSVDSYATPEKSAYKLKKGTRTYHHWTEEEDDFILNHSAGLSSSQLAYKFGVTIDALRSRKLKLLNGTI